MGNVLEFQAALTSTVHVACGFAAARSSSRSSPPASPLPHVIPCDIAHAREIMNAFNSMKRGKSPAIATRARSCSALCHIIGYCLLLVPPIWHSCVGHLSPFVIRCSHSLVVSQLRRIAAPHNVNHQSFPHHIRPFWPHLLSSTDNRMSLTRSGHRAESAR